MKIRRRVLVVISIFLVAGVAVLARLHGWRGASQLNQETGATKDGPIEAQEVDPPAEASVVSDTGSVPPPSTRVAETIAMLKEESVDDSLARLGQVNLFFSPGPHPLSAIFPSGRFEADPVLEMQSVHAVLSNRRVLKLYVELSQMPDEKRPALLNKELSESLGRYLGLYNEFVSAHNNRWSIETVQAPCPETGATQDPVAAVSTPLF